MGPEFENQARSERRRLHTKDAEPKQMLSPRQFGKYAAILRRPGSGFSVNIHSGAEPQEGYMVSDPTGVERVPTHEISGQRLHGYAQRHESSLTGSDRYVGGWHPHRRPADLDRSTRFPREAPGFGQAYAAMVSHSQEAMYSVHEDKDIPNPAFESNQVKRTRRLRGENVP